MGTFKVFFEFNNEIYFFLFIKVTKMFNLIKIQYFFNIATNIKQRNKIIKFFN